MLLCNLQNTDTDFFCIFLAHSDYEYSIYYSSILHKTSYSCPIVSLILFWVLFISIWIMSYVPHWEDCFIKLSRFAPVSLNNVMKIDPLQFSVIYFTTIVYCISVNLSVTKSSKAVSILLTISFDLVALFLFILTIVVLILDFSIYFHAFMHCHVVMEGLSNVFLPQFQYIFFFHDDCSFFELYTSWEKILCLFICLIFCAL